MEFFMENVFLDANMIYDAGTKAMSGSKFKYATQLFETNHLLYTAMLQKSLREGTYEPSEGNKFLIRAIFCRVFVVIREKSVNFAAP